MGHPSRQINYELLIGVGVMLTLIFLTVNILQGNFGNAMRVGFLAFFGAR